MFAPSRSSSRKYEVVCVEYDESDRPFSISVAFQREGSFSELEVLAGRDKTLSTFDANWCKRDETLYVEDVGGGPFKYEVELARFIVTEPKRKIWLAPLMRPTYEGQPADLEALGYKLIQRRLVDPFKEAEEGPTIWCSICGDNLPCRDDEVCDHIWYCETSYWFTGPGYDDSEPCKNEECWNCRNS